MGCHRKPKLRPTGVAAIVTAAIIAPAGTAAAAASFAGSSHSSKPDTAPAQHATSAALTRTREQHTASTPYQTRTQIVTAVVTPVVHAKATTPPAPKAVARTVASANPNPYAGVTLAQLEVSGLYGYQETFTPSKTQWENARTIVEVAHKRGMPAYAAVIGIATALQESTLHNLTSAVDHDSLGLFQQRPSCGWGTPAEVTDPTYAANKFFAVLSQYSYMHMPLWSAAQTVQRSGFPTAYAKWEKQAANMVLAISRGTAP